MISLISPMLLVGKLSRDICDPLAKAATQICSKLIADARITN